MAREHRVSMAELIRRGIDEYLRTKGPVVSREELWRRALAVPSFNSGISDLAENHDKYLEEAYMNWKEKEPAGGDLR